MKKGDVWGRCDELNQRLWSSIEDKNFLLRRWKYDLGLWRWSFGMKRVKKMENIERKLPNLNLRNKKLTLVMLSDQSLFCESIYLT